MEKTAGNLFVLKIRPSSPTPSHGAEDRADHAAVLNSQRFMVSQRGLEPRTVRLKVSLTITSSPTLGCSQILLKCLNQSIRSDQRHFTIPATTPIFLTVWLPFRYEYSTRKQQRSDSRKLASTRHEANPGARPSSGASTQSGSDCGSPALERKRSSSNTETQPCCASEHSVLKALQQQRFESTGQLRAAPLSLKRLPIRSK
jgi:hypothetical protein